MGHKAVTILLKIPSAYSWGCWWAWLDSSICCNKTSRFFHALWSSFRFWML